MTPSIPSPFPNGIPRLGRYSAEAEPGQISDPPPAAPQDRHYLSDVAVVFEGGGMRASYTSAVVVALIAAGLDFGLVTGISAGSSNAINYLSRDIERARISFTDFAADPKIGNLKTFLQGRGLFDGEYIYENTALPHQALPFDYASFVRHPGDFQIGAFRCDTGQMVYWGREDTENVRDLAVRVRASSSLPILMPITYIDDIPYLDGAIGPTGGIPIDAAEAAGYKKFIFVLTRSRDFYRSPVRFETAMRRRFRSYPLVAEGIISRPKRYNATRERIFELERAGQAMVFAPRNMSVSNSEKNVAKLRQSYKAGMEQILEELPAWMEWLGIS